MLVAKCVEPVFRIYSQSWQLSEKIVVYDGHWAHSLIFFLVSDYDSVQSEDIKHI